MWGRKRETQKERVGKNSCKWWVALATCVMLYRMVEKEAKEGIVLQETIALKKKKKEI